MYSLKELTAKTISLNLNQECLDEIKEQIQKDAFKYVVSILNFNNNETNIVLFDIEKEAFEFRDVMSKVMNQENLNVIKIKSSNIDYSDHLFFSEFKILMDKFNASLHKDNNKLTYILHDEIEYIDFNESISYLKSIIELFENYKLVLEKYPYIKQELKNHIFSFLDDSITTMSEMDYNIFINLIDNEEQDIDNN